MGALACIFAAIGLIPFEGHVGSAPQSGRPGTLPIRGRGLVSAVAPAAAVSDRAGSSPPCKLIAQSRPECARILFGRRFFRGASRRFLHRDQDLRKLVGDRARGDGEATCDAEAGRVRGGTLGYRTNGARITNGSLSRDRPEVRPGLPWRARACRVGFFQVNGHIVIGERGAFPGGHLSRDLYA